jgi:hypothetical protein
MVVVVGSLWDLEFRSWNVEARVQLQVRLLKREALLKEGWAHSEEPAAARGLFFWRKNQLGMAT